MAWDGVSLLLTWGLCVRDAAGLLCVIALPSTQMLKPTVHLRGPEVLRDPKFSSLTSGNLVREQSRRQGWVPAFYSLGISKFECSKYPSEGQKFH